MTAVYRGVRLTYHSFSPAKDAYLLSTEDAVVADTLGFRPYHKGGYQQWVPRSEVSDFVEENWFGILDGHEIYLEAEDEDHYWVYTMSHPAISNWNLEQIGKCEWAGPVPKTAFTSVWCERKPRPNP